ncbi:carbon starvation protein [Bifidobacterium sp. GSD1FS]|uniref:Carbon starvation protein n=1 Tax=Bifidobacterium canis TaxID=2610880 RepID=A0A7K1J3Q6_9BIFI|nr:carbon starvation protein [Bifidobacterium canis]
MYALTSVACAIWLVQTCVEANANGDLLSWSNIIFALCLTIVTVYCAVNAVRGWVVTDKHAHNETSSESSVDES